MDVIFEESKFDIQLLLKLKRISLLNLILNTKPNTFNEKESISSIYGSYDLSSDKFVWNYAKLQKLNDPDLAKLYVKIVKSHE